MRIRILTILVCLAGVPAAAQQNHSAVADVLHTVGGDFQQLPTRETVLMLGGAVGLALGMVVEERDRPHLTPQTDRVEDTFEAASMLGHSLTQIGGTAALFMAGHLARQPRLDSLGLELMRAQTINSALTQGLKFSIGRTRPDGGPRSFPSGHTSAAFATATVLKHEFGWKVGVPSYLLAGYIGASRVAGNHHYGSDVVVGAAVGLVSARAVTRSRSSHNHISVTPALGRRSAGMVLTWNAAP